MVVCVPESSQSRSHWRVFLLSEPSPHLPVALLLFSHQLAWDVVQEAHYDSLGTPSVTSLTDTIVSTLKVLTAVLPQPLIVFS